MPVRGPRLKIVRRLGTPLPGLTREDAERRPYPPGQHGLAAAKRRTRSLARQRLEEKQKVRVHYGITELQLGRVMAQAKSRPGVTGHTLFSLLERRLDNVVFRLGFAPTIPAARQLVAHGHVRVNGRRVDRPAALVDAGATVSLSPRARAIPAVIEAVQRGPQVRRPSYLALDPDDPHAGRVVGTPVRADVPFLVHDAAIIEFYAR